MGEASGRGRARLGRLAGIGVGAAAVAAAVLVGVYLLELSGQERAARVNSFDGRPVAGPTRVEFLADGITPPPASPAAESGLAADEEIVGVVIDGRARAYRLAAMDGRFAHVVNDRIGDRPVTVTYCNINEGCVRAFGGEPGGGPLGVGQGGLLDDRMVLVVGGTSYLQDDGTALDPSSGPAAFPHPEIAAIRTTWGAWRAEHPETDAVADLPPPPAVPIPDESGR